MSKAISILIVVVLISAIAMLLYPTVSDQYNLFLNNRRILSYTRQVETVDSSANAEMLEAARAYNDLMRNTKVKDAFDAAQGAGHMEGTSLPVGGESTHCGIAGHRGLPSAKLFSDLDQMQRGDVIYLNVLGELMVYQVDQISVVLPHETDYMSIIEGGDYLTLVTCTPYGVNSHRLLVRGKRADLEDLVDVLAFGDSAEKTPDWQGALVCAAPVIAVGLLLMLLIRPKRKFGLKNPKR